MSWGGKIDYRGVVVVIQTCAGQIKRRHAFMVNRVHYQIDTSGPAEHLPGTSYIIDVRGGKMLKGHAL